MNIGIIGAGAIGGWVAAKLALASHGVSVLARGKTVAALQSGLKLTEGGATTTAALTASGDPAALGPQELLIIAVKAPALAEATESAAPMIGPDTIILPMLNGVPWWFPDGEPLQSVDPGGRITAALPAEQVVGCVVHASCRREAPNHAVVTMADKLILGEPRGEVSERLSRLDKLFEQSGIHAVQSGNVRRDIWYKLWGNATMNPLSALTGATADRLLADPELRAFMAAAMKELAEVGGAIGCPIGESSEDRMAVTARLGAFKTSMLQDAEGGRALELDALVGAVREIGARFGVPTPEIDTLFGLTRLMARQRRLYG